MTWWELEIAVPAERWCATVATLAGRLPHPGTGALLVRDVTARGEPALYVQARTHDGAELTRWYSAAVSPTPPGGPAATAGVAVVRPARLVPLAGPVFGGPALPSLTRGLLHRAAPAVAQLAGLGAGRRSTLLHAALAVLTAHLATQGPSAAPGAAAVRLHGVPLGFLSLRSHAEAYFATCRDPGAARADMDARYHAAKAGIDATVARVLDQARAGTLPDGPARHWHTAVTVTRPDFLDAFRGGEVTVAAPPDPRTHADDLAASGFHRKAGASGALQDYLRGDPAFLAVRLTTSLLYLVLHTAGMSLAERYFACHLVSRACEALSGTDAMTVLDTLA
ncbi:hypothetical protein [Actinoplanes sp. NPDC051494]|uniref:hypothetical protein n=1 Tax=Actinoplanes sp. NPDC051494 TaxID=3363907 RepID=UPI003787F885